MSDKAMAALEKLVPAPSTKKYQFYRAHYELIRDEITTLRQQLEQAEARVAELLTICQAVQRDLLLRAEPDWDGSGQKVVNLSAGFWEELNRVIGKYDDTACKSFDALILRKQADAVENEADQWVGHDGPFSGRSVEKEIRDYAVMLRQQADEAERAGGERG